MKKLFCGILVWIPGLMLGDFSEHLVRWNDESGMLEAEDGSVWKVLPEDIKKASEWKSEGVRFTALESWLSKEVFCYFINPDSRESVRVELSLPATESHASSHWVSFVEVPTRILFLDNGAIFSLYENDREYFTHWEAGDFVIVGDFKSLFSPCRHILFNYRTKEFIFGDLR